MDDGQTKNSSIQKKIKKRRRKNSRVGIRNKQSPWMIVKIRIINNTKG